MIRHWALLEADLAREYGLSARDVAGASTRRFLTLVGGLPAESRFMQVWARTPRQVSDPVEIARLTSM